MIEGSYSLVVQKVFKNGRHGPYAVVHHDTLGDITFSLEAPVWRRKELPEEGIIVVLSALQKKRAGWRANRARFFEPRDEQPLTEVQRKKGN